MSAACERADLCSSCCTGRSAARGGHAEEQIGGMKRLAQQAAEERARRNYHSL
jgi:hypothetical protein